MKIGLDIIQLDCDIFQDVFFIPINSLTISNTHTADITFDLVVGPKLLALSNTDTDAIYILKNIPIPTGSTFDWEANTFLRTIGTNLILARIGSPVCADKFNFTPFKLFSSLRTVDSLKDNESFFYAELKRLKQLIQLYQEDEEIFFLLDEILKGTNSADQHKGSVGLINKLVNLKGNGVIATHDIELAGLANEFPDNIRNLCFEIEIINNQLDFDYKIKPGFCTTMNASFLMENMGII